MSNFYDSMTLFSDGREWRIAFGSEFYVFSEPAIVNITRMAADSKFASFSREEIRITAVGRLTLQQNFDEYGKRYVPPSYGYVAGPQPSPVRQGGMGDMRMKEKKQVQQEPKKLFRRFNFKDGE